MDLVAGAGGIFGQLAVGLAGGMMDQSSSGLSNGFNKMAGKLGGKPTIDSLPDKVSSIVATLIFSHFITDERKYLLDI